VDLQERLLDENPNPVVYVYKDVDSGMMASARFRRLWLVTCLTLLGGLATLVPVNCLCVADEHWGQAVHPLYPHTHAEGLEHATEPSHEQLPNAWAPSSDTPTFAVSEHGSFAGPVVDGAISSARAALVVLALLALLRTLFVVERAPMDIIGAPPTAPPRLRPHFA
jgi:hypothetical protein